MTTLHWGSSNERWVHFAHEGDYSGYVTIIEPENMAAVKVDRVPSEDSDEMHSSPSVVSVRVPMKALLAFFRSYMRHELSYYVADMTDKQLDRFILSVMKDESDET